MARRGRKKLEQRDIDVDRPRLVTLTNTNTLANFILRPPDAFNDCTRMVLNQQPSGTNLTGPVTANTISIPDSHECGGNLALDLDREAVAIVVGLIEIGRVEVFRSRPRPIDDDDARGCECSHLALAGCVSFGRRRTIDRDDVDIARCPEQDDGEAGWRIGD